VKKHQKKQKGEDGSAKPKSGKVTEEDVVKEVSKIISNAPGKKVDASLLGNEVSKVFGVGFKNLGLAHKTLKAFLDAHKKNFQMNGNDVKLA